MTRIDLIRHGEPVGGRRYRGQLDDPLSERGWQQMRDALAGPCPWQFVLTSPLRRCREFAHRFAGDHGLPVRDEPRFREIGFGAWEGRRADELQKADPDCVSNFLRDPVKYRPADAEPLDSFAERVTSAWQELLQHFADRHVLVVAHAGVIRVITAQALGMPVANMFRLQVDNAAINRIHIDGDFPPRLVLHNGVLHNGALHHGTPA